MKRVFIIHGWGGGPESDWCPWLKTELKSLGYEAHVPSMPDTDSPVIEKWVAHLKESVGVPDEDTFFVGHSVGCQAILRYLETLSTSVGGAVFVAGWFNLENLKDDEEKNIAQPWIENPINVIKIRSVLKKSTLVISDNDPHGAFEENKRKFAEIGSEILVLENAGHITKEDGFTKIPIVIEQLQEMTD